MFNSHEVEKEISITPEPPKKSIFKWVVLGVGTVFGAAHIGVLGHLMDRTQIPKIDLPLNEYSSYVIRAGKDGYVIEYKGNDPKVMTTTRDIKKSNGLFGIGGESEITTYEQYTMDGARHMGGGAGGKFGAKREECIKAAGGGESTGRIVGASIGASAASFLSGIPYIGWVAAGWIAMLGQDTGAEVGGELATTMTEGCDELTAETSE